MNDDGATSTGLFVLGMHRSGTSALTRVLNLLGMHLGDQLLGAREGNTAGHWEPIPVIELNERLLAALGRTWDDPRDMESGWLQNSGVQALLPEASLLLGRDYLSRTNWLIKDPRLSRLLPFWLQAAQHWVRPHLSAIIAVRHPWEVASSLHKRDGIAPSKGMLLWLQHTTDALAASQGIARAVVGFEDLLADWREEVERLSTALNLRLTETAQEEVGSSIDRFLRRESRHEVHDRDRVPVPEVLQSLYDRLKSARDEREITSVQNFAMEVCRSSKAHSDALTDIYVHKLRLHKRVVELEVAASEANFAAYERRDEDFKREMRGITQHLSHADWVNQELEKKWREAENELHVLKGAADAHEQYVSRLENANQELDKKWLEAQSELCVLKDSAGAYEQKISRLESDNQELSKRWREAENEFCALKGANSAHVQQILLLQEEKESLLRDKEALQTEVKSLCAENRLQAFKNDQMGAEMKELASRWYTRIGRLLHRGGR